MKYLKATILTATFLILGHISLFAFGERPLEAPKSCVNYPNLEGRETHRIVVQNSINGAVMVSMDNGASWEKIGSVIKPNYGKLHKIMDCEFTASDWAPIGGVAAAAVNGIHIKTEQRKKTHANIFSVLPKELMEAYPSHSYRDASATIFTDIAAGTGIFSVPYSPNTGSGLYLFDKKSSRYKKWPRTYAPNKDDVLMIISLTKDNNTNYIEIENKKDGFITINSKNNSKKIACVTQPIKGVGRFGGTVYQKPSKIRANHMGVICVSTSPEGKRGGFQIVPSFHAQEPNLKYVYGSDAYMLIRPLNIRGFGLEGTYPLFSGLIRPGDIVKAKIKGKWQLLPTIYGKVQNCLSNIELIRIYPTKKSFQAKGLFSQAAL
jgi:hypothetical protein